MIFDVEPLVAYWDSGQEVLDQWFIRRLKATAYGALPGFPPARGRRLDSALVLYDPLCAWCSRGAAADGAWGNRVVTLSRPQQWPGQRDQN
jgi:hypothetical protein